jgi:hypothetical protein
VLCCEEVGCFLISGLGCGSAQSPVTKPAVDRPSIHPLPAAVYKAGKPLLSGKPIKPTDLYNQDHDQTVINTMLQTIKIPIINID